MAGIDNSGWYQTVKPGKGCEFNTLKEEYLAVRQGAEARGATVEERSGPLMSNDQVLYQATVTEQDGSSIWFNFFDANANGLVDKGDNITLMATDANGKVTVHKQSGEGLRFRDSATRNTIEVISDEVDNNLVVDLLKLSDNLEDIKSAKDESERLKAIQAAQEEYRAFVCPG